MLFDLFPPLIRFLLDFRAHTPQLSSELISFPGGRAANKNNQNRGLLKSRGLFSFDIVLLNEVSQYTCVAEFVGWKIIESNQSINRTQGDVTLWKIHEHSRDVFFIATQLQF